MKSKLSSHFKFREINSSILVTNEVGDYDFFKQDLLERLFNEQLDENEKTQLGNLSVLIDEDESWKYFSLAKRVRDKYAPAERKIGYLILIPTLRCNLSCSYCQVSRAPEKAKGFDWDEDTLKRFEAFIKENSMDHLKVEFQGGEPSLRLDKALIELVKKNNFTISTSIDGSLSTMTKNRTFEDETSKSVFDNFNYILENYGPEKIAALPTITENQINSPEEIIQTYDNLGFQSIFLRPVNYMGFARKKHKESSQAINEWNNFYLKALDLIKNINRTHYFEEFYLALLVREIFTNSTRSFVDYRSPQRFLNNYLVIDFDEQIYPSDEARMLSRTKHVNLAMGDLKTGINEAKLNEVNVWAENQTHPDCMHCAYQSFCGIDIVDDMSRYQRFDIIKKDTWFCNRQMFLFDFIFEKVEQQDREWLDIFLKWISRSNEPITSYELF